jgi:hypothetical protein
VIGHLTIDLTLHFWVSCLWPETWGHQHTLLTTIWFNEIQQWLGFHSYVGEGLSKSLNVPTSRTSLADMITRLGNEYLIYQLVGVNRSVSIYEPASCRVLPKLELQLCCSGSVVKGAQCWARSVSICHLSDLESDNDSNTYLKHQNNRSLSILANLV